MPGAFSIRVTVTSVDGETCRVRTEHGEEFGCPTAFLASPARIGHLTEIDPLRCSGAESPDARDRHAMRRAVLNTLIAPYLHA